MCADGLVADPGELYGFLRRIACRSAGVTLVSIPPSGRPEGRWVDLAGAPAACHWAYGRNRAGGNLYWTPAETSRPLHRKPRKEFVARVSWVWVDVDPVAETAENLAVERVTIESRLRAADPDLLIDSGRGFWAFWRLAMALEGVRGLAFAERVNRALSEALDGDKSAWNSDRLARLPGSISRPNRRKAAKGARTRLARCLVANWDRSRGVDLIVESVPGAAAALAAEETKSRHENAGGEPACGLRPTAGPTRGGRSATTTSASLPSVSLDVLERFPGGALRIALELVDAKGRAYPSRSEAAFAFAASCARGHLRGAAWLSRDLVAAALLQAELPVSEHVLEQPDPVRTARRTVDRAFDAVAMETARWRARRRRGIPRA